MAVRVLAAGVATGITASLLPFAVTLGAVLLLSSISASLILPQRTALVRNVRGEEDPPLGYPLVLLLVILCAIAMMQTPGVMNWSREEWTLARSVLPEKPDSLGLSYLPIAGAMCLPVLTALTVGLFALTSLLAIVAPSKLAFRVIAASVLLQLGYIGAIVLTSTEIRTFADALTSAMSADAATSPGLADSAQMITDWVERHGAAAERATQWLVWTSIGYLFAAGVAYFAPKGSAAMIASEPAVVAGPVTPATAFAPPPSFHTSAASAVIDESNYSVHPRMTLVEALVTRVCTNFEIRTIPRQSRKWFSFSWTNGVLRQEPQGPKLVTLTPPDPPGLFFNGTYYVSDSSTSKRLARFEPRGADWEIIDESGALLGRILRESRVRGFVQYRAFVGDEEVVRYKWTMSSLTVFSAELEVEFLSAPGDGRPSLDRLLALVIAPVLEQKARLASMRANS